MPSTSSQKLEGIATPEFSSAIDSTLLYAEHAHAVPDVIKQAIYKCWGGNTSVAFLTLIALKPGNHPLLAYVRKFELALFITQFKGVK